MLKITFMGAGSTVFAKNVLGDTLVCDALRECEIALYDIDKNRLSESEVVIRAINKKYNADRAVIKTYLGVENRKAALRGAKDVYKRQMYTPRKSRMRTMFPRRISFRACLICIRRKEECCAFSPDFPNLCRIRC